MKIELYDDKNKVDRIIEFVEENVFEVESKTTRGMFYQVNLISYTCECPHYNYRLRGKGGICDHHDFLMRNIEIVLSSFSKQKGNNSITQFSTNINAEILKFVNEKKWIWYDELIQKFPEQKIKSLIYSFDLLNTKGKVRCM